MKAEMEVSLYPLADGKLQHPVEDFTELLEQHGCTVEHTVPAHTIGGEFSIALRRSEG